MIDWVAAPKSHPEFLQFRYIRYGARTRHSQAPTIYWWASVPFDGRTAIAPAGSNCRTVPRRTPLQLPQPQRLHRTTAKVIAR